MNIDIANGEPGVLSEVIPCGAGKAIIDAVVFDYDAKSGEAGGLEFPSIPHPARGRGKHAGHGLSLGQQCRLKTAVSEPGVGQTTMSTSPARPRLGSRSPSRKMVSELRSFFGRPLSAYAARIR